MALEVALGRVTMCEEYKIRSPCNPHSGGQQPPDYSNNLQAYVVMLNAVPVGGKGLPIELVGCGGVTMPRCPSQ